MLRNGLLIWVGASVPLSLLLGAMFSLGGDVDARSAHRDESFDLLSASGS